MADEKKFLADIQSDNADVRFAAWRGAGEMSAAVIPELGKAMASPDPGIAKAAMEALTTMTHSVGADPANPKRAGVAQGLIGLAAPSSAPPVRAHAFRMLSNIAGEPQVAAIAKYLGEAAVREEAIFALEQIPGDAALKAIAASYAGAPDEFKPRILAALGHRRAAAGVPLALEALKDPNLATVIAALKAFGRIGARVDTLPGLPDPAKLTAWQYTEGRDSVLRYADSQAALGDKARALSLYKVALGFPEEHYQCAAVIGLSKLGTSEAAAAIMPLLKSGNSKVRITAQNAWKSMSTAGD